MLIYLSLIVYIQFSNSTLWEFKKHENNPVITPDAGEWDHDYVLDGHMVRLDDEIRIYYVGYNGWYEDSFPSEGIGYSYSQDFGSTWQKYRENPVFVSDSSEWERTGCGKDGLWEADIVYRNEMFHMWYQAKDTTNSQNTLYATSSDGIHWTRRNNSMPVLKADPDYRRWDSWWCGARSVIYAKDSIYLFYEGMHRGGGPIYMGLAVGENESTFTKVDTLPVFKPEGTVDTIWCGKGMIPNVIYMNSTFVLFFSGGNEAEAKNYGVGLAFSKDGRNWRRYRRNPVYDGELGMAGAWDSLSLILTNVFNVGSADVPTLFGVYRARKNDWVFRLGVVTIDVKDLEPPKPVILIEPTENAVISGNNPQFCWSSSKDNLGVEYYILKYGDKTVETEDTTYNSLDSLPNGKYKWMVQAIDSAGWESEWRKGTFTIGTGIEDEKENFFVNGTSNPVKRKVNMRYYLPHDSKISLKIYDITGRIIEKLIDKNEKAGHYTISWDTGDVRNGLYFAEFSDTGKQNYKKTEKLVIIK